MSEYKIGDKVIVYGSVGTIVSYREEYNCPYGVVFNARPIGWTRSSNEETMSGWYTARELSKVE